MQHVDSSNLFNTQQSNKYQRSDPDLQWTDPNGHTELWWALARRWTGPGAGRVLHAWPLYYEWSWKKLYQARIISKVCNNKLIQKKKNNIEISSWKLWTLTMLWIAHTYYHIGLKICIKYGEGEGLSQKRGGPKVVLGKGGSSFMVLREVPNRQFKFGGKKLMGSITE